MLHAARLSTALADGWVPDPQPTPIPLFDGERHHATVWGGLSVFCETPAAYSQSWCIAGGPIMATATLLGSALLNGGARSRATAQAAAQWRPAGCGTVYLTDRRFGCQLSTGWTDVWFDQLRNSAPEPDGIVLWRDGVPPLKLHTPAPQSVYVMFRYLAYGESPPVHIDADLEHRAAALQPSSQTPDPPHRSL